MEIIEDIVENLGGWVEVKLKNRKYHKLVIGFYENDFEKENIILKVGKTYFSKDENTEDYEYILEKLLNYNITKYIKNKIVKYFKENGFEVIITR